jgi:hypothetical protein
LIIWVEQEGNFLRLFQWIIMTWPNIFTSFRLVCEEHGISFTLWCREPWLYTWKTKFISSRSWRTVVGSERQNWVSKSISVSIRKIPSSLFIIYSFCFWLNCDSFCRVVVSRSREIMRLNWRMRIVHVYCNYLLLNRLVEWRCCLIDLFPLIIKSVWYHIMSWR